MILRYVLDTDVISETAKPLPSQRVIAWIESLEEIVVSAVTTYELEIGIRRLREGRRKRFLEAWFERIVASAVQVVPFDHAAAMAAARIEWIARQSGRALDTRDLFILGIAYANGLCVATRNTSHFAGHGVPTLDPFAGGR